MSTFKEPYNFVPLDIEQAVNKYYLKPYVSHEGLPADSQKLSGEVECTATSLTRLLVGNIHVPWPESWDTFWENARGMGVPEVQVKRSRASEPSWDPQNVEKDHTFIFPFCFPSGRFGIPRSGLRGVIRNMVAALTSSPMERVNDRWFFIRPNQRPGTGKPGILLKIDQDWWILHSPGGPRPDFGAGVESNPAIHAQNFDQWCKRVHLDGLQGPVLKKLRGYARYRTKQLRSKDDTMVFVLPYSQGVDDGTLAEIFASSMPGGRPPTPNTWVGLAIRAQRAVLLRVPDDTLRGYERTTDRLVQMIRESHPLVPELNRREHIARKIKENRALDANNPQVVFFEDRDDGVVTFGKNYHYRWTYVNSTRTRREASSPDRWYGNGALREEMRFVQGEWLEEDRRLTPCRRLFGFVRPSHDPEPDRKDHHGDPIPKAPTAYAGRVAFSFAVQEGDPPDPERFVTLKELGTPKPSAVECYLTQDGQFPLKTYGDPVLLPDRVGQPRGRKFYFHQPDADAGCPERGNRNATAVELLPAGTRFRFMVRFENLEPYELGLLLFALTLGDEGSQPTRAHKIGYGQPLGLGSMWIEVSNVRILSVEDFKPLLEEASQQDREAWHTAFLDWFANVFCSGNPDYTTFWDRFASVPHVAALDKLTAFPGEARPYYRGGKDEIYEFHSKDVRVQHARVRSLGGSKEAPVMEDLTE